MILSERVMAYFLSAGLLLVLTYAAPVHADVINLIQNPSLETGAAGVPAGWSKVYWGSPTPTFTYPDVGHTGVAAKVTYTKKSSGDARWAHTPVTVTAGKVYIFSSWYKSNIATEIDAEYTTASGKVTYALIASVPSSGNVWLQKTATITVPAGVTKMTIYHIIQKAGSLTIDDYSLTPVDGAVPPPPPPLQPTLTLTATPLAVTVGEASTLTWSAANATACTASNGWSGAKTLSGSQSVSPTATTTYALSCTGAGGTAVQQVQIGVSAIVTPPPPPPPPPPPQTGAWTEGMVSFSFDDSWDTQYTNALPILTTAGIKATFYLTTQPVIEGWSSFMTPANIVSIAQKGHEIAGHTITHPDLTTLSAADVTKEVTDSKSYLQTLTGKTVTTFAYPYGAFNQAVTNAVQAAGYTAARGVYDDYQNVSTSPRHNLYSSCLERNMTMASIQKQILDAKNNKTWYIMCFHEIRTTGGDANTITPVKFQQIVDYVKSIGVKVVTVQEGTLYLAP